VTLDARDLSKLPNRPGVYLFKDADGTVLYVGKAKSLRSRVRSYFRKDGGHSLKTRELSLHAHEVDTIIVGSEAEALILEANLIKEYQPSFNIQFRDDKSYPYIAVTVQESFPRVFVTRRVRDDGTRYLGPYTSVGSMRQALEVIKRLYTVRSCRYNLPKDAPERACLDHHIGRCEAPCVGLQTEHDYRAMIDEIVRILGGETEEVRADVEHRMHEASRDLDFEAAAKLRDVLPGLDTLAREQRVQKLGGGDLDVLGLARDGELAAGVVMRIRRGVLLGRDTRRLHDVGEEGEQDLLGSFAVSYYLGQGDSLRHRLPSEVVISGDFADMDTLGEILTETAGRRVHFRVPQRGEKLRLAKLAGENARHALEDRVGFLDGGTDRADQALFDLQDALRLKIVPRLMVCFDVSHTQGSETVGSAVVFENGEPKKSEYRHMRIKGEWGNDDYRSMAEVVERYFRRRVQEGKPLPDLALIDGGRGQLGAAAQALDGLGVTDVSLASLAKKEELVYVRGTSNPLRLGRRNRALHVLQRIRDESHRFAVSYNRKLRRKRTLRSALDGIPGIGSRRQKVLLTRFGSLRGVKEATADEIARIPGFSLALANRVLTYLGR
jgi:excinuclease ABC subunit C